MDDAARRARHQHGRRVGNAPAARARQRLDHREARRAGSGGKDRGRHGALQGKLPRPLLSDGGAHRTGRGQAGRQRGDVLAGAHGRTEARDG